MVQTRSSSSSKKSIAVNRDVAEGSMNQKKSKTTSENSNLKPIEENAREAWASRRSKFIEKLVPLAKIPSSELVFRKRSDQDRALEMFMIEYKEEYFRIHPEATMMPSEDHRVGQLEFLERVKQENSEFVNGYLKKYYEAQDEYERLEKDYIMGKLSEEDMRKNAGWACNLSPTRRKKSE